MLTSITASITPIIAQTYTTLLTGSANQNEETEETGSEGNSNTGTNTGSAGTGTTTTGTTSGNNAVASKNAAAAANLNQPTELVDDEPAAELDADALRNAAIATQNKLQNDLLLSSLSSKTEPKVVPLVEDAEAENTNPVVSAYMEYAPAADDKKQQAA